MFELYTYNGRNLHLFNNYRVVGESRYYCLSKDNSIFEKYNAYRTRFDMGGRGRRFKFKDKFGNVYIKPNEMNKYFYSDIDLYLENILTYLIVNQMKKGFLL